MEGPEKSLLASLGQAFYPHYLLSLRKTLWAETGSGMGSCLPRVTATLGQGRVQPRRDLGLDAPGSGRWGWGAWLTLRVGDITHQDPTHSLPAMPEYFLTCKLKVLDFIDKFSSIPRSI